MAYASVSVKTLKKKKKKEKKKKKKKKKKRQVHRLAQEESF